jgi:hypothetical protein
MFPPVFSSITPLFFLFFTTPHFLSCSLHYPRSLSKIFSTPSFLPLSQSFLWLL